MKTKYLLTLLVCLSSVLLSQSLTITKTDGSTIIFKLADIDSVLVSTASQAKTVSAANWICINNCSLTKVAVSSGVYEDSKDGLKVFGNGNYSVRLLPASQSTILNKTIYLQWKVSSSTVTVGVALYESAENLTPVCRAFSISANSGVISADTWYFTRIIIAGGEAAAVTAKDNFDNNGGTVIANSSVPVSKEVKTYSFETTTDKTSYSILSEARVE